MTVCTPENCDSGLVNDYLAVARIRLPILTTKLMEPVTDQREMDLMFPGHLTDGFARISFQVDLEF